MCTTLLYYGIKILIPSILQKQQNVYKKKINRFYNFYLTLLKISKCIKSKHVYIGKILECLTFHYEQLLQYNIFSDNVTSSMSVKLSASV
jgi:CII-binding regulator of phage lambda lysogenization HflD